MAQYAYFASQHATAASWTAKLASANARAASSGRSASPYSNTFRLVCSFQRCQARRPPAPHSQNQAWPVIAGVRCIALSSASSAFLSAESCANGGAGRRASPEAMSQVLQLPARGKDGIGAGPGTWRDWDRAGPFRLEAICFSALDGLAPDRTPEC